MYAMTLFQPTASNLFLGDNWKTLPRSFYTSYRGVVAIHAGARQKGDRSSLPHAAVIGLADLILCANARNLMATKQQAITIDQIPVSELRKHAAATSTTRPFLWVFARTVLLPTPIPIAGQKHLWHLPDTITARLEPYAKAIENLRPILTKSPDFG